MAVIAEEKKQRRLCDCGKRIEAFWMDEIQKCVDCAENLVEKLKEEFFRTLSSEQLAIYEKYKKAQEELVSLRILA